MLVFATNQIKLFAVGGIRRGGHQPSGNLKEYSTNLGNPKILKIFVQTMGEFVRKEQSKIDYYY
jgi:hypothetical protein